MIQLPLNYTLGENDVLCGRGRKCSAHIGNKRFLQMVRQRVAEYTKTATKIEKSLIIMNVIDSIRDKSLGGGFVKTEMGRYYALNDEQARERVSQAFRDALHYRYRSSNETRKRNRKCRNLFCENRTSMIFQQTSIAIQDFGSNNDRKLESIAFPSFSFTRSEPCICMDQRAEKPHGCHNRRENQSRTTCNEYQSFLSSDFQMLQNHSFESPGSLHCVYPEKAPVLDIEMLSRTCQENISDDQSLFERLAIAVDLAGYDVDGLSDPFEPLPL